MKTKNHANHRKIELCTPTLHYASIFPLLILLKGKKDVYGSFLLLFYMLSPVLHHLVWQTCTGTTCSNLYCISCIWIYFFTIRSIFKIGPSYTIERRYLCLSYHPVLHHKLKRCTELIFRNTETIPSALKGALALNETGDVDECWFGESGWACRGERERESSSGPQRPT